MSHEQSENVGGRDLAVYRSIQAHKGCDLALKLKLQTNSTILSV